jgi:hypothetical protein
MWGLPVCITTLLAKMCTFSSNKGVREKTCKGLDFLKWFASHAWSCVMPLACWSYLIDEQGPRVPLKIVGVMTCLPCYLTTMGGLTLWTCGLGPHLQ